MSTITVTPPLDTPEQISAEIAWVAAEARALLDRYDEPERRVAFNRRKQRLLRATYAGDDCPAWCTEHLVEDEPVSPEDDKLTHQTPSRRRRDRGRRLQGRGRPGRHGRLGARVRLGQRPSIATSPPWPAPSPSAACSPRPTSG